MTDMVKEKLQSKDRTGTEESLDHSKDLDDDKMFYKFVITGGPCGGKTTAMERLQVFLRERGFRVFVVPEAATILFTNGASPDDLASPECETAFQSFVIGAQIQLEDSFMRYAKSTGKKSVLLCDRGIMDGSAYVTDEIWSKVLSSVNLNSLSAREGRYDAIFHLVTAADGAQPFYSLANNEARHETIDEAILQDRKTQNAWNGHPQHVVIDNRNGRAFERKLELLVSMLSAYVGLPSTARRSHKYELLKEPDLSLLPNVQVFEVEKIMLEGGLGSLRTRSRSDSVALGSVSENEVVTGEEPGGRTSIGSTGSGDSASGDQVLYSFIRKRSQGAFSSYGLTTVKKLATGEKVELKKVITKNMYNILAQKADLTRVVVNQRRYCFQWDRQSIQIYEYISPLAGTWIVNCQTEETEDEPKLPDFLQIGPELTRSSQGPSFSDRQISLRSPERKRTNSIDELS